MSHVKTCPHCGCDWIDTKNEVWIAHGAVSPCPVREAEFNTLERERAMNAFLELQNQMLADQIKQKDEDARLTQAQIHAYRQALGEEKMP